MVLLPPAYEVRQEGNTFCLSVCSPEKMGVSPVSGPGVLWSLVPGPLQRAVGWYPSLRSQVPSRGVLQSVVPGPFLRGPWPGLGYPLLPLWPGLGYPSWQDLGTPHQDRSTPSPLGRTRLSLYPRPTHARTGYATAGMPLAVSPGKQTINKGNAAKDDIFKKFIVQ